MERRPFCRSVADDRAKPIAVPGRASWRIPFYRRHYRVAFRATAANFLRSCQVAALLPRREYETDSPARRRCAELSVSRAAALRTRMASGVDPARLDRGDKDAAQWRTF